MSKRWIVLFCMVGLLGFVFYPSCSNNTNTGTDAGTDSGTAKETDGTNDSSGTSDSTGTTGSKASFFVTSVGVGDGAKLGGLEGADAHCKKLAEAAGIMGKTWKAYLSTSKENARDRIGAGPWYNVKDVLIANGLDDLHGANALFTKDTALDEKGNKVNGRGDTPNRHDILTGSDGDGKVSDGKTCEDWTSNTDGTGSAMVGHHDRMGLDDTPPSKSWNSSHASRGCSQDNLKATGGDGLFYCFATN